MRFTLAQQRCRTTALRVAAIVGTVLFTINHGRAALDGEMNSGRWLSAMLTYCVPFMVSIHGQSSQKKSRPL
ncbi:MAG: nitrate/nitrite transporter NrtS [Cyanobacteria bacterium P01_D01_bin.1]